MPKNPPRNFQIFYPLRNLHQRFAHPLRNLERFVFFVVPPKKISSTVHNPYREVFKFFNPLRKLRRPVIHPVRKLKTFLDPLRKSHQQVQTPLESEKILCCHPRRKLEVSDPLRKSRQRGGGGVDMKWNGP